MSNFFTQNYDAFRDFSNRLEKFAAESNEEVRAVDLVKTALKAVTFNRDEYDALTPYSVSRQGQGLLQLMQQPLDLQMLQRVLLYLAGFIREASLVRESRSDSEQKVLDHFLETNSSPQDDDWGGYHADYLRYVLPNKLFENNYKAIDRARNDAKKLIEDTESRASDLEERINGYRSELKKFESEYNFVALSHAFKGLLSQKSTEGLASFGAVILLALAAISAPMYFLSAHQDSFLSAVFASNWSPAAVAKLLAALGIEVVVLYFFRVALRTYLLTRSQITNLQLRVALCTFIEGYLDFAAKAQASKSAAAIAGFEGLIFSGLPSQDPSLPATLDGLEQITKLVQAARG